MFRIAYLGSVLAALLVCAGCAHDSRPMASNDAHRNGEGVRFDANGNNMYDPSVREYPRTQYADGDRAGHPAHRSGAEPSTSGNRDWNGRNARNANTDLWRDRQNEGDDIDRALWGDGTWNDSHVVTVSEWDMPSGARSTLSREAGGAALSETGRGMWDGKQAYCARVMKNGHPYKVISDADGNLIAMRRLD